MKKIFTLILSAAFAVSASAQMTTAGDNTTYTMADLAKIEGSGVTVAPNTQVYTLATSLTIAQNDVLVLKSGDVLKLGDGVVLELEGYGQFNPEGWAMITRTNALATPKGLYIRNTGDIDMKNVVCEYAQVHTTSEQVHTFENCTFRYIQRYGSTSKGALAFSGTVTEDGASEIINCKFIENDYSGIIQAANCYHQLVIKNCYFYHNNTQNANQPQINITYPGVGKAHVIEGNMLIGKDDLNRVGAIAVAQMMAEGGGTAYVENNTMFNNRYGFTVNAATEVKTVVKNNNIVYNMRETNAMNGGSGISFYGMVDAYVEGNLIEGNLWGVTIIGSPVKINFGKTDDPNAEDYNPGLNVFKNNGNDGKQYDFYNNSALTCYAQGNVWTPEEQDSVSVSAVVWDIKDVEGKGEVIFATKYQDAPTSIDNALTQTSNDFTYDAATCEVKATVAAPITVYSMSGVVAKMASNEVNALKVDELTEGVYVARNENTGDVVKFVKK